MNGRFVGWLVGVAAVVAVTVAAPAPSGALGDAAGFAASASAQGMRVTFTVPGFAAVEDVIDGGGPVAQAGMDGQGATSSADLPYPGDVVLAGPGLFNAVTGMNAPGAYPFHVAASHPTAPEQSLSDPGGFYRLRATAGESGASGLAGVGPGGEGSNPGPAGAQSIAMVTRNGDTIVARAETVNRALAFGDGAVTIASVRSRSVTTYAQGAEAATTDVETIVEGGAAGGYQFRFGPGGLVVANQAGQLPAAEGLRQLNAALEPSGIALRVIDGARRAGGGSADSLEIIFRYPRPNAEIPAGILRIRLGGASTAVIVGAASSSEVTTP
ncbi:MAG TPA: hypothetical protein VG034_00155 [Acidimicrobiia bacterium]|jgi:hypothetical protein|nr:hypothetical protein [Acidimicrobiia bacterium]